MKHVLNCGIIWFYCYFEDILINWFIFLFDHARRWINSGWWPNIRPALIQRLCDVTYIILSFFNPLGSHDASKQQLATLKNDLISYT